ncbi:MAG: 4-oxalocrotonate tautomerase [Oscillospiraceae bacterium]|nr:4-oxalocrotonate tautomerase [Oscillospiraceae bacterium]
MPYISVECGALSDTQKVELIQRLTQTASEVMRVPQEFFTVTIKELPDLNFGIGGQTIDKVKAEYMLKHQTI